MKRGRITVEESHWLDVLYERANMTDDWTPVKRFYMKLASKYHFDYNKVSINRAGDILDLEICYKCGEIATDSHGTDYVKDENEVGKMINYAICNSCLHKHFPEQANKI